MKAYLILEAPDSGAWSLSLLRNRASVRSRRDPSLRYEASYDEARRTWTWAAPAPPPFNIIAVITALTT